MFIASISDLLNVNLERALLHLDDLENIWKRQSHFVVQNQKLRLECHVHENVENESDFELFK